jgi:hypothetical protein
MAVLGRAVKRHSRRCAPPKASAPGHLGHFSCKKATSEGAEEGAKGADHGPPAAQLPAPLRAVAWGRRSCRRCGSTCSRREKNSISLRPDGLSDQNNFGEMDAHRRAAVGMRRRESPDSSPLTRLRRCAHVDCQRLHSRNQECEHSVKTAEVGRLPLEIRPRCGALPAVELVCQLVQAASAAQRPATFPECPVSGVNTNWAPRARKSTRPALTKRLPSGSRTFSSGPFP